MKIKFEHGVAYYDEDGIYDIPVGNEDSTQVHRYTEVDGELVDIYPGLSDEDVIAAVLEAATLSNAAAARATVVNVIKSKAGHAIEALDWKIQRATELDAINGTNTFADVYADREAIRKWSNDTETSLDSLLTTEEIYAVNTNYS